MEIWAGTPRSGTARLRRASVFAAGGNFRGGGIHCTAVGSSAALRIWRTPCGCFRRAFEMPAVTIKTTTPIRCGCFYGGLERDRTLDFCDAKRHLKLFCMISNYLWCFPLDFSFFPPLFRTLISMCCAAVCGASCGQKRSPPFAGNGFPAWMGSIFCVSDCLDCNSEGGIMQVISVPSIPQKLEGCKQ